MLRILMSVLLAVMMMLPFASDVYAVPEGTSQSTPVADEVPSINPSSTSGSNPVGTGGDDGTTYNTTPDGGVQVGDVESTVDDMLDGYNTGSGVTVDGGIGGTNGHGGGGGTFEIEKQSILDDNFLDEVMLQFSNFSLIAYNALRQPAFFMWAIFGVIEITTIWTLYEGRFRLSEMISLIMKLAFFYFLMDNWYKLTISVLDFFQRMAAVAITAISSTETVEINGKTIDLFKMMNSPSSIINLSFATIAKLWSKLTITAPVQAFMYLISILLTLIGFFVMAVDMFVTYLEFYFFMALSIIFLPLNVCRYTKSFGQSLISGIIGYAAKLMVLMFIVGIIFTIVNVKSIENEHGLETCIKYGLTVLALGLLTSKAGSLAQSLVSGGGPVSSGSEMRSMGMNAYRRTTGGISALTHGSAALAGRVAGAVVPRLDAMRQRQAQRTAAQSAANVTKQTAEGAFKGGKAGAKTGASVGGTIGSALGPVGTTVGQTVGGVAGGVAGAGAGAAAGAGKATLEEAARHGADAAKNAGEKLGGKNEQDAKKVEEATKNNTQNQTTVRTADGKDGAKANAETNANDTDAQSVEKITDTSQSDESTVKDIDTGGTDASTDTNADANAGANVQGATVVPSGGQNTVASPEGGQNAGGQQGQKPAEAQQKQGAQQTDKNATAIPLGVMMNKDSTVESPKEQVSNTTESTKATPSSESTQQPVKHQSTYADAIKASSQAIANKHGSDANTVQRVMMGNVDRSTVASPQSAAQRSEQQNKKMSKTLQTVKDYGGVVAGTVWDLTKYAVFGGVQDSYWNARTDYDRYKKRTGGYTAPPDTIVHDYTDK